MSCYTNPILAGFFPDPSICRVDEDYFLVCSSFAYFPGIPIFHSRDLVNWRLIGHAIGQQKGMNLTGLGVSKGIFAPSIAHHRGRYYITCTLVDGGGNFTVTSKDAAGPWSDPVWMPAVNGIDPSIFFDGDDTYLVYNSVAPDDQPLYNGHRTIRMRRFDADTLQPSNEERILVNGGSDIGQRPRWIEGPHLLKRMGWYYLIAAEGGTGYDHAVVAFRSRRVEGPYEAWNGNPLLTQRHGPCRKFPITSTGHAQLVDLPDGRWMAVFLGCRPYEGDHYNTGRETFLAPVIWKEEWPRINEGYDEVQYRYPLPLPKALRKARPYSGNFSYQNHFNKQHLGRDWMFLRTPKTSWHTLGMRQSCLSMQLRAETCAGSGNPSFIGRRQQHLCCSASTKLIFEAGAVNEKAGLIIFQNEDHFFYLCQSINPKGETVVQLYRSVLIPADGCRMDLLAEKTTEIFREEALLLKIEADKKMYRFYYKIANERWQLLKDGIDAKFLSTRVAGGFVGCTFGLYATALGKPSDTFAHYDWFRYEGKDDAFSADPTEELRS